MPAYSCLLWSSCCPAEIQGWQYLYQEGALEQRYYYPDDEAKDKRSLRSKPLTRRGNESRWREFALDLEVGSIG